MLGLAHQHPRHPQVTDRVSLSQQQVTGDLRLEHTGTILKVNVSLRDLSETGVGLLANKAVEVGALVVLKLTEPEAVSLIGEIVWCSRFSSHSGTSLAQSHNQDHDQNNDQFRVGMKFMGPSLERAQALKLKINSLA